MPVAYLFLFGLSLGGIFLERKLRRVDFSALIGGAVGLLFAFAISAFVLYLVSPITPPGTELLLRLFLLCAAALLGITVGVAQGKRRTSLASDPVKNQQAAAEPLRLLDSSVLIDGRIADIAESGFLSGQWLLPQFVLNELQTVADSADTARRNRGRRGLDIALRLKQAVGIDVQVSPLDYPNIHEVDRKLIEGAKSLGAQIVTTDFNLNKLAQAQGLRVLNINELANALRPAVLQGENLRVCIAREGKEPGQGVAFLEDGTMVVADNARHHVGKTVDITVTSVIQSAAGKMIFGRYEDTPSGRLR